MCVCVCVCVGRWMGACVCVLCGVCVCCVWCVCVHCVWCVCGCVCVCVQCVWCVCVCVVCVCVLWTTDGKNTKGSTIHVCVHMKGVLYCGCVCVHSSFARSIVHKKYIRFKISTKLQYKETKKNSFYLAIGVKVKTI